MTLVPLTTAPLAIQLHAWAALAALGLGILQLLAPKGTLPHRSLGWLWVLPMAFVALSSFRIHTICTFGGYSLIHLLSVITLVALPLAVLHARRHRVMDHARAMRTLFLGALLIAGAFTLLPGCIMHDVVFGITDHHHGSCAS